MVKVVTDQGVINRQKWNDYVLNHPEGNIFQTPEMYDVYQATSNYEPVSIFLLNEEEDLLGLVQGAIVKERGGIAGLLTSRVIINGGLLVDATDSGNFSIIIDELVRKTKSRAVYTQIRNLSGQEKYIRYFKTKGFYNKDHFNIILDLKVGSDLLWENFSRSRKKGIRKAQKGNLRFEVSNSNESIIGFYKLLCTTYRRIKLPVPGEDHFLMIGKLFGEKGCKVFSIFDGSVRIAALFVLIFKNKIYGYYMGSVNDTEILKQKPLDLLFWEVFNWAISENLEYFDWMGAGAPGKGYGVRDFKLEFGGELINYGRLEKVNKPVTYNFAKGLLYIWQKI